MVKFLASVYFVLLGFCSYSSNALELIELESARDISSLIKPGTWVFTDFDRLLVAKNLGTPDAFEIDPLYTSLLKNLQEQGVPVFGLTARSLKQADYTENQLKALDIDFSKSLSFISCPTSPCMGFDWEKTGFKNGVLYSPSYKKNKKTVKTKGVNLNKLLGHLPCENRSLVVLDDQKKQLASIQKECTVEGHLVHVRFHGLSLFAKENVSPEFPTSFKELTPLKTIKLFGRQVLKLAHASSGKVYLLYTHDSNNVMKEEVLALRLYEALGCAVPNYRVIGGCGVEMDPKKFRATGTSIFILTEDTQSTEELTAQKVEDHLRNYFMVDAFLSHYGLEKANTLQRLASTAAGEVLRTDMSATLRSDLKGKHKRKMGSWSLSQVLEFDLFRDVKRYPRLAAIYASLTPDQLKAQMQDLLTRKEKVIAVLQETDYVLTLNKVEELVQMMTGRFADIEARLAVL